MLELVKTVLIAFPDSKGLIHHEFVPEGQTVNAGVYGGVLKRLVQRIRRIRPELYQSGQWNFLHDNARSRTVIRVLNFLAQRKVTVLPHPPHSPDLAPADFSLFLRLKWALKGLRLTDVADIKQRVTTVIREIPQEAFFWQLYDKYKNCVVPNGDYFEGQLRYFVCNSCFLYFLRPFTEL